MKLKSKSPVVNSPVVAPSLSNAQLALWVGIGANGTTLPPYLAGRSEKFVSELMAGTAWPKPFFVSYTLGGNRGVDNNALPLAEQTLGRRIHSWIARKGTEQRLMSLGDALRAKLVQLVTGRTISGNPETLVLPANWTAAQRLPQITAVLPSKTWTEGRIESKRIADGRNDHITGTAKAPKVKVVKVAKTPKAPKAKPVKPTAKTPAKPSKPTAKPTAKVKIDKILKGLSK